VDEHKEIWKEIKNCLNENQNNSEFFNYFDEFITQFSPQENKYTLNNVNHILNYLKTVLDLIEITNTNKKLNMVELGSNQGIISKTLQLFGHNILCTDLHHGIITNSINSYKVGTWIREVFIGINAVDTFKFKEDNLDNLCVFDSGIDVVLMRGTGIINIGNNVKNNIIELLNIINKGGVLFAKNENIFCEYELEKRIEKLEQLSKDIIDICSIDYKIEEVKYINQGWESFNITIVCKKK
jgi:hypothetical protein